MKTKRILSTVLAFLFVLSTFTFNVGANVILRTFTVDVETIYLDPENGNDSNDGLTEGTPVKTVARAYTLMRDTGANDGGNLVLLSNLAVPYKDDKGAFEKYFGAAHTNLVTISGKTGTEVLETLAQIGLLGPTKFENIALGSQGFNHWNTFNAPVILGSGITKPAGYTNGIMMHVGGNGDLLGATAFTGNNLTAEVNSGTFSGFCFGGAYLKNTQNIVTGDANLVLNGGIGEVSIGTDIYNGPTFFDIVFEGNVFITVQGSALITKISPKNIGEIKGSYQVIVNNGKTTNVTLPENAAKGAYFVKSAVGGTVTHTATPGVFNITPADSSKIIKAVNGTETMYFTAGDIALPTGQTNITYVDGTTISDVDVSITAPVAGAVAQTSATSSADYSSTIEWIPALTGGTFGNYIAYTAKVTISPADNKALTSATTINGLTPVKKEMSYGKLIATFEFPKTAKPAGTYAAEFLPGAPDVTGTAPAPQFVPTNNATLTLPANPFTRVGYKFIGWAVKSGSATPQTYAAGATISLVADVQITPAWEVLLKHTVAFSGNGATGGTSPLKITAYTDSTVILPKNSYIYPGYTFAGWTADGGITVYPANSAFTMPDSDVVFSALWTPGEQTDIVYLKAGGNGDGSSPDKPLGTWANAIAALKENGGIISVIGPMNVTGNLNSANKYSNMITITGYDKSASLTINDSSSFVIGGPTKIENINIRAGAGSPHYNSLGYEFIIGENVTYDNGFIMLHGGSYQTSTPVESTTIKVLGSDWGTYFTTGAYNTTMTSGVTGDANILVDNGGSISAIKIGGDGYLATHVGGTHEGNVNIIINNGKIGSIGQVRNPIVNGAIQMVFNNGARPTVDAAVKALTSNVYTIYAGVGGKVELTDTVGTFKITSDYDITINGTKITKSEDNLYALPAGVDQNILFGTALTSADTTIEVTLGAPVGGVSPYSITPSVPAGANYTAEVLKWNSTSNVIDNYGVFDFETVYTAKVSVIPKPGYYFTDGIACTLNGKLISSPEKGTVGNLILSETFAATGVAPSYTVHFVPGSPDATGEPPAEDGASWKYLSTHTLPFGQYSLANNLFVGWTDGFDSYKAGSSFVMPNYDVTFTAQWFKRGNGAKGAPFILVLYNMQEVKDYGKNPDFPKNKKYPVISLGGSAFASLENAINGTKGLPEATYDGEKVRVLKTDEDSTTKVIVNNWSLASAKAEVGNYKYVSFTYYYESETGTGGAIGKTPSLMLGYFQLPDGSNSKWLAKHVKGNKPIVANKWDTITFDISAAAEENGIDAKSFLKQVHFYFLGDDVTAATIKGDSIYLKDFIFSADAPIDHSADEKK